MQLTQLQLTAGDTRRFEIKYDGVLAFGDKLASVSVISSSGTSTAQNATLDVADVSAFFFVTAGPAQEMFTVTIQVKTTFGETINDTMVFVVNPVTVINSTTPAATNYILAGPTGPVGPQGAFTIGATGPGGSGATGLGYDPMQYGAGGNARQGITGSINNASNTFTQSDYAFTSADVGKSITITGAGVTGANLSTTISGIANSSTATLATAAGGNASTSNYLLASASIAAAGTGVMPGDTFQLAGLGTYLTAGQLKVSTTKVVSASTNAAGSGGATGTFNAYGTTGTGSLFGAVVTIAGGQITGVSSVFYGGSYTVNPTSLLAEPITVPGSGLTGATLTIVMGVQAVSALIAGNYSVLPSNPVTPSGTSGSGAGVTFNLNFTKLGAWAYGTDDTAIIAAAGNLPVFLEQGKTFFTTTSDLTIARQTWGFGKLFDVNLNNQSPRISTISAAPASIGNWNSPDAAFTGDLSSVQLPLQHFITGSATLGTPSTGYLYTEEAYPIAGFLYNNSGNNQSTSAAVGRTAACFMRLHLTNVGQGDGVIFNGTATVGGAKTGATSFLANPAATLFNGDVFAINDGVYLNPIEVHNHDQGFDVAAVGYVISHYRANDRGNLGAIWYGFRSQVAGTVPIDAHISLQGATKIGIDLTGITTNTAGTWTNAAIVLNGNDRLYFNGTPGASPLYASSTGTTYMSYNTSNSGILFVINNTAAAIFQSNLLFLYAPTIDLGISKANYLQVIGTSNGSPPQLNAIGTNDASVDMQIMPQGPTGTVYLGATGSWGPNLSTVGITSSANWTGPSGAAGNAPQEWLRVKDRTGTVRYIPAF